MAKTWTDAEREAIVQMYPVYGGEIVWPWRTREALTQEANRMGYRSGINRMNKAEPAWPQPDVEELRAMRAWGGPVDPGLRWGLR